MKKVFFAAIAALALAACGAENDAKVEYRIPDLVSVEYGTFNGNRVVLKDDSRGHAHLCVLERRDDASFLGEENLNFLIEEVRTIVTTGEQQVGEYTLKYVGGKPAWAPYATVTDNLWSYCMYFGDVTVSGQDIIIYGQKESSGYYGYSDM